MTRSLVDSLGRKATLEITDLAEKNIKIINGLKWKDQDVYIATHDLNIYRNATIVVKPYHNPKLFGTSIFAFDKSKPAQKVWNDYIDAIKMAISRISA